MPRSVEAELHQLRVDELAARIGASRPWRTGRGEQRPHVRAAIYFDRWTPPMLRSNGPVGVCPSFTIR